MSEYQNDWELPVNTSEIKVTKNYSLEDIYDHTHSELSLQQSKRDQIITLFLDAWAYWIVVHVGMRSLS